MKLLSDRILIRKNAIEKKTASGIIVPDEMANKNEGVVVLIGNRVQHIKEGDTVRHKNECGIEIEYLGEKCLLLRESSEIEAILNR